MQILDREVARERIGSSEGMFFTYVPKYVGDRTDVCVTTRMIEGNQNGHDYTYVAWLNAEGKLCIKGHLLERYPDDYVMIYQSEIRDGDCLFIEVGGSGTFNEGRSWKRSGIFKLEGLEVIS